MMIIVLTLLTILRWTGGGGEEERLRMKRLTTEIRMRENSSRLKELCSGVKPKRRGNKRNLSEKSHACQDENRDEHRRAKIKWRIREKRKTDLVQRCVLIEMLIR